MHEAMRKSYECAKQDIDRWYTNTCRDQILENKRNDAIECIYCIGKAFAIARILEVDFGEDLKEERLHMEQIKNYLQFDLLESIMPTK